jgi:hypothetical protein
MRRQSRRISTPHAPYESGTGKSYYNRIDDLVRQGWKRHWVLAPSSSRVLIKKLKSEGYDVTVVHLKPGKGTMIYNNDIVFSKKKLPECPSP